MSSRSMFWVSRSRVSTARRAANSGWSVVDETAINRVGTPGWMTEQQAFVHEDLLCSANGSERHMNSKEAFGFLFEPEEVAHKLAANRF